MEEDGSVTPGSKMYWDDFYCPDSGPLRNKQRQINRRHDSSSDAASDSVLDHYEWFTTFDVYEDIFLRALRETFMPIPRSTTAHVLHVGCGNSAFSDHFLSLPAGSSTQRKQRSKADSTISTDVLNVDICGSLMERLQATFPTRQYATCDCCDMICPREGALTSTWYTTPSAHLPCRVFEGSVDIIFDKGTMDALLSAFPGEENPNAMRFCCEALRALRTGGVMILISINSVDVLMPYFVSPNVTNASFELCFKQEMDVANQFSDAYDPSVAALRVETLGTRYTMYVFRVVGQT
jgi:hypothetical protein